MLFYIYVSSLPVPFPEILLQTFFATWLLTSAITHSPSDSLASQCISGGKRVDKLKTVLILPPYGSFVCQWFREEVMEHLVTLTVGKGQTAHSKSKLNLLCVCLGHRATSQITEVTAET